MRIVCLSDTHNYHDRIIVPDGDILIHAGDATLDGRISEIENFNRWLTALPHKHKIFVAGNHDWLFETNNVLARKLLDESIVYLEDSAVEIEGLKIYGSPWQPRFYNWAFNLDRGPQMAEKWKLIPDETNILITHGPPNGILDEVPRVSSKDNAGCEELRKRVDELSRLGTLRLHVFGHIHCGYGQTVNTGVNFVNAANCDEAYEPNQPPIIIEI